MAMLEVKDLHVYYGVIQALKGISFEVNQGEVIALIGANGAGKTTTLQTLTGLLSAKEGSVVFEGKDITRVPAHKIVEKEVIFAEDVERIFGKRPWTSRSEEIMALEATAKPVEVTEDFEEKNSSDSEEKEKKRSITL